MKPSLPILILVSISVLKTVKFGGQCFNHKETQTRIGAELRSGANVYSFILKAEIACFPVSLLHKQTTRWQTEGHI